MIQMERMISAPVFVGCWAICSLLMMEIGRRAGKIRLSQDPERGLAGLDALDGTVFALFGLLVAFTFSGGAARFDSRRELLAQEVNDIGTAYLRLDLLPADAQPPLRGLFREYVGSRLAAYGGAADLESAKVKLAESEKFQGEIWRRAVAAATEPNAHQSASLLLLPALNSMFDITTTRLMAARLHPPAAIYFFLFIVGLAASAMAGYGTAAGRSRNWFHILGFMLIMALSLYVILDMEYPRRGFIRLDAYDQDLVELRDKMK